MMSDIRRTTRECSVSQLNPRLLQAFRDYFRAHQLGDPESESLLCCETVTERGSRGSLAVWLDGNPDASDQLGLILTERWLIWARHGDRSGTITAGIKLTEMRARTYDSRLTKESGLQITGNVADAKGRAQGNLALGPEPAARNFCERVLAAINTANPPSKGGIFSWLRR
jgi:hypothetical protein